MTYGWSAIGKAYHVVPDLEVRGWVEHPGGRSYAWSGGPEVWIDATSEQEPVEREACQCVAAAGYLPLRERYGVGV